MVNRVDLVGTAVHDLLELLGTEEGASDCGLHGQVATLGAVRKVRVENLDAGLADVGSDEGSVDADKATVVAHLVAFVARNGLPLLADVLLDDGVHGLHVDVEHIVDAADSCAVATFAGDCLQFGSHIFGHRNGPVGQFCVFDHSFLSG